MNPYLKNLRTKYDALRSGIEGLQTRAADENRDLTEDELRSIQSQGEQAAKVAGEIESLTEIETRNAKVAALASDVAEPVEQTEETRAVRVGTTTTKDRDPGHYTRSSNRSFFGDLFAARSLQDEGATRRLLEHNRALDMAGEGPGVIPPVWMSSEFAELATQQRRVANAVRNLPLSSAAPMSLPRQSAGAVANAADSGSHLDVVKEQSAENGATTFTDVWNSAVDTVSPKATSGGQIVSRQMLDSSNPAVDALIYSDLVAAYNVQVEAKVVQAMVTAAGTAVDTFADNEAFAAATGGPNGIVDAAIAVRNARKLPADVLICNVLRYGEILKWKDSSGRPLMPLDSAGPMNVIGTGSVAVDGRVHGLGVLATDGVASTFPENILVARASDTILWESPVLRFRYEEPNGPESIKLGIWAYTATYVKYTGASVKKLAVTIDSAA